MPSGDALASSFAQTVADARSGNLQYSKGVPFRPTDYSTLGGGGSATAQLMQQINATDARQGNALRFPEAGLPKGGLSVPPLERIAAPVIPPTGVIAPAGLPKNSLPSLPIIPPGSGSVARVAGKAASLLSPIGDAIAIADIATGAGSALINLPAKVRGMAEDGALAGRDVGKFLDARRDRLKEHPEQAFPFDELLQHLPFIPRKKSSNLPDYLEPRGQRIPVGLFPVGTYFEVTFSSPGRTDVFRAHDLTEASAKRTEESRGGLIVFIYTVKGSDSNYRAEIGNTEAPSVSTAIIPDGGGARQPVPTPGGASSPGDAPSIPQSAPLTVDPSIAPAPQPKPRSAPSPNQAPAPEPERAPEPARAPARAPAPAPAINPAPAPAAQPAPAPARAPAPAAQPASTPGQSPSPGSGGAALRSPSLNPDRFPDSPASTENGPLRAPSLNPDKFPDPAPSKQPDAKAPSSPSKAPDPTIDPTAKPQPQPQPQPKPQTERQCDDPCIAEMQAQNAPVEIKIKIFKACKTAATPATPATPTGTTPATPDNDDKAIYEDKTIKVPKQEADTYKLLYERIAKLEALQCNERDAIATVPEWWQLRAEAQRPQLIIVYAEVLATGKLTSSRWALSLPHYNRPKGYKPTFPTYEKGNFEGIYVLSDNSKIIVNAKTATECKRVINSLKINIDVKYRSKDGKQIQAKIGERSNDNFKVCRVLPIRADFYATGMKNMNPDWSINLRK